MEDNENINKDPDVSPTNSWVFVENSAVNNESDPSADHLKNETKIQKLNEDDLGGSSSCDSDGISVISETECYSNGCCESVFLPNTSEDDVHHCDLIDLTTTECFNSCCVSECLPNASEDDDSVYNCDLIDLTVTKCFERCCVGESLPNTSENDDDVLRDDIMLMSNEAEFSSKKQDKPNNNAFTFASTVAGVCIIITYLISNYNSATTTYHETDVTIEDFDEMLLWTNYDDNDTCDFNINLPEINTDISHFVSQQPDVMKPSKLPTNTINQNENVNKEKSANKRDKHISRNSNNNIKKIRTKARNTDNQKTQTEDLKQHENYLKKKEKYLTKREKHLKKLEKHIVTMEARFRKFFNKMKKVHQQFDDQKYKQRKSKINGTATAGGGEWYEKMSFGRSEIRHKETLSDWMFERSKMRNKLRDKAHWYFNRANGREEFRSSENKLRSGKRNHFKTYRY